MSITTSRPATQTPSRPRRIKSLFLSAEESTPITVELDDGTEWEGMRIYEDEVVAGPPILRWLSTLPSLPTPVAETPAVDLTSTQLDIDIPRPAQLFDAEPDGMQAYLRSLVSPDRNDPNWPLPSFDGKDWAQAFIKAVKTRPWILDDEGTMVAWFANALMRGYDERALREARGSTVIDPPSGEDGPRDTSVMQSHIPEILLGHIQVDDDGHVSPMPPAVSSDQ
jgi:hypothetical protein